LHQQALIAKQNIDIMGVCGSIRNIKTQMAPKKPQIWLSGFNPYIDRFGFS